MAFSCRHYQRLGLATLVLLAAGAGAEADDASYCSPPAKWRRVLTDCGGAGAGMAVNATTGNLVVKAPENGVVEMRSGVEVFGQYPASHPAAT